MKTLTLHSQRWLLAGGVAAFIVAMNLAIGVGAAVGQRTMLLVTVAALLPAILLGFGALVESHRAVLAWIALALNFVNLPFAGDPLPLPGGTRVFPADALLLLAVASWVVSRLSGIPQRNPVRLSIVFTWPLALLTVAMLVGIVIGHERYGATLVGQPLRVVLYAGIALALTDVSVAAAWRAITFIFYAGAVIQACWAVYYLATGTSQTESLALSTGGTRVLSLSAAMYLTGSLVCALLNLDLGRGSGRQSLHLVVAGLAMFGIVVSFGRTTYAAVVLIVPILLVTRRYARRSVLLLLPLFVPVLATAALVIPNVAPSLAPTLEARLSGTSSQDSAVSWRELALDAHLEGVADEWLTGVGFGRVTQFTFQGLVFRGSGDPHNSYAWVLAGGGALALVSLLLLCAMYVIDAGRRLRRASPAGQALVAWSVATWIVFMINALTGPVLADPDVLLTIWVLMALPALVPLEASEHSQHR